MPQTPFRAVLAAAAAAAAGAIALVSFPAPSQAADVKPAEEVYKNITQLKGMPADQLNSAMNFMSISLGVNCLFCHVEGNKFEADDKPAKKTAREMIAMQAMINKETFHGQRQVTCYSCHRGSARPVNMPPIEGTPATAQAAPPPRRSGDGPTVDSIVQRFIDVVGGADALQKVSTRVMKGVMLAGGVQTTIDVYTKAPNKRLTIVRNAALEAEAGSDTRTNDQYTAYDGKAGWMGRSGQPAQDMSIPDSEVASIDAEFALPLRLKEMFPQLRRGRPEEVNGRPCEVLNGSGPGRPSVRLYFDTQTGLLIRMIRYVETPLGRMPTQVDYSQYQAIGGVNVPFVWTVSRIGSQFTIKIIEASENVLIDDAKFAKPSGTVK